MKNQGKRQVLGGNAFDKRKSDKQSVFIHKIDVYFF